MSLSSRKLKPSAFPFFRSSVSYRGRRDGSSSDCPLVFSRDYHESYILTSSVIFVLSRRRSSFSYRHPSPSWRSAHQSTSRSNSADRHERRKVREATPSVDNADPSHARVAEKDVCGIHAFPRSSSSCCCCSFFNLQLPPSCGGRSIYRRRATACACDVLNLSREEVEASARRPTHTSFFGTLPSVFPFPLQPARCLLFSFALWSSVPFYVASHSSQGVARRAVPMPFRPPAVIQSTQECFRRVTVSLLFLTFFTYHADSDTFTF